MDAARYYVALLLVAFFPPAILYWFSIHPFVHFWRRVGTRLTYWIHVAVILLFATAIILLRARLLSVQFGTQPVLVALAIPFFLGGVGLRMIVARQLKNRILSGFPELDPEKFPSRLLTGGIYSRIRHPRYAQLLVSLGGFALFTNYLVTYAVFLLYLVLLLPLVHIEERELRARFGPAYDAYAARVPRFIPRLHARSASPSDMM